jgi:hypothetical protein
MLFSSFVLQLAAVKSMGQYSVAPTPTSSTTAAGGSTFATTANGGVVTATEAAASVRALLDELRTNVK